MMINWRKKTTFVLFLFFSLAGCVGSKDSGKARNSMPASWSIVVPVESKTCASIDGVYKILGLGKFKEGAALTEMRLDAALGHTFPTSRIPKQVSIAIEKRTNTLNVQFGDPANLEHSERISCSQGWYVFKQRQTDQYVGDGAKLDYSLRKVELGKESDGSLIVHLILEGQFSSFAVLKSHEVTETWSKYEVFK